MLIQNNQLKSDLRMKNSQNVVLKEQVTISEIQLAVATVYYNEEENTAYIDAKGLPTPPKGKVYQVWSLVMDPLTSSSIDLLSDFKNAENKFFKMENIPPPEGDSESPTLSQLYTLGMVTP